MKIFGGEVSTLTKVKGGFKLGGWLGNVEYYRPTKFGGKIPVNDGAMQAQSFPMKRVTCTKNYQRTR